MVKPRMLWASDNCTPGAVHLSFLTTGKAVGAAWEELQGMLMPDLASACLLAADA